MAFNTKINLSNDKVFQNTGQTVTLSGDTVISLLGNIRYDNYPTLTGDTQLVTKKYVDLQISGATSGSTGAFTVANNGLCSSGQIVSLGGTLTGNTTICIDTHQLYFEGINADVYFGGISGINAVSIYTSNSEITANTTEAAFDYTDAGRFTIDNTGAHYCDKLVTQVGIRYIEDYSANYTNRSLVDKGYIDLRISGITSGSTGENNNIYAMTVVTGNITLTTGSTYVQLINSPTSGLTITLPANPINGQVFRIKDVANTALTYAITIARNGKLIDNTTNDGVLNTNSGALELVYNNSLGSWFVFSFVN